MRAVLLIALALAGCSGAPVPPLPEPPVRPTATESASPPRVLMAAEAHSTLQVEPPSPLPPEHALGAWRQAGATADGRVRWTSPLPFRVDGATGHVPADGMSVHWADRALPWQSAEGVGWSHDAEEVILWLPADRAAPTSGEVLLRAPGALVRHDAMHPNDVADQRVRFRNQTWSGLLLPGAGDIAFELQVPTSPELILAPAPAPAVGGASGPLTLQVMVNDEPIAAWPLTPGDAPTPRRVDLSTWEGQEVRLRFQTTAPVFLGAPSVRSRSVTPRRVVLITIDKLRADHLTQAGYARATTAPWDELALASTRFSSTRTSAPWTTPSLQAAMTGRLPHRFEATQTLAEALADAGFATAWFTGAEGAQPSTGLGRGYQEHHHPDRPAAAQLTDAGLRWLAQHDGHDALLHLRYTDLRLPYREPARYHDRFGGSVVPAGIPIGGDYAAIARQIGEIGDPEKQWLVDRYDSSLAYVADEVKRLVDTLSDDTIVVVFGDHGVEFHDHNYFGQGHTIFDEQLRVPLWIRAPGLPAGEVQDSVNLLDLTPTLRDLLGLPSADARGGSLRALAQGDPAARARWAERPEVFGWTHQTAPWWGVRLGDTKWVTRQGREQLYDLALAPDELTAGMPAGMEKGHAYRAAFGDALGLPTLAAWRFELTPARPNGPPHEALCSVPGGFGRWAVSPDPFHRYEATVRAVGHDEARALVAAWDAPEHAVNDDDGHILMAFAGHGPEVFVETQRPAEEVGHAARCTPRWCVRGPTSTRDCPLGTLTIPPHRDAHYGDQRRIPATRIGWDRNRHFIWGMGMTPLGPIVEHGDVTIRATP